METLPACFITPETRVKRRPFHPAWYLRQSFRVAREIQSATLHVTACGLYRGFINGTPLTDHLFTPGFTYYAKRLQVQTYDVTALLQAGENVLGFIVGDGWYRGKIGVFSKRYYYGTRVKLAGHLEVVLADGTRATVTTSPAWRATQAGPIRKSDWKDGEVYDARREMPGWSAPGYDDGAWGPVYPAEYPGTLVPTGGVPVREQERFHPSVITTPDGATVLDFGQNLFGYVEFTVTGPPGHRVRLLHGETLDEAGNFTQENLTPSGFLFWRVRTFQVVEVVLGNRPLTYKPTFTGHGFRYVKLVDWPEPVDPAHFTAIAVHSDCARVGEFECSDPRVNQLVHNALWSQKSNFVDIPTDCPQRERAGWTGDISCYAPAASYLMDVNAFLARWLADVAAQQRPDGAVGAVVPAVGLPKFTDGSAGWADAIVTVPHLLYRVYGNKAVLGAHYPAMCRWVHFLEQRARKTHLSRRFKRGRKPYKAFTIEAGFHFGEWLEPGSVMARDAVKGFLKPDFEVATACYAYTLKLMVEVATALGKEADARRFGDLLANVKRAYRGTFTNAGLVESSRQCRYVRPVAYDLLDEEEKSTTVAQLNEMVVANDYKIGTGFLTTPWVLQVLSDHGYVDTAYGLLENPARPGWLYEVSKGATTIWENWNGIDEAGVPKDSQNHYLMGSVVGWLFSHVAGIRPLEPGYAKILLQPLPGGSLTRVACRYDSTAGLVTSAWTLDGTEFHLEISVPVPTEVRLPDGTRHEVGPGEHEFRCTLDNHGDRDSR